MALRRVLLLAILHTLSAGSYSVCTADDELTDKDFSPQKIDSLTKDLATGGFYSQLDAGFKLVLRGPESRDAIPAYIAFLSDERDFKVLESSESSEKDYARSMLAEFGRSLLPFVEQALDDDDMRLRMAVLEAVSTFRTDSVALLPTLTARMDEVPPEERQMIVHVISRVDETGEVAVPLLLDALEDPDPYVRIQAVVSFNREPSNKGPGDASPGFRPQPELWLEKQPEHRAKVLKALLRTLDDESPRVRAYAAVILRSYPDEHQRIVPALLSRLDDPGEYETPIATGLTTVDRVDDKVVLALARFAQQADHILPALIENLTDRKTVSEEYKLALTKLAPHGSTSLAMFSELLNTNQWESAVQPLGRLGQQARATVPQLERHLTNAAASERSTIAAAILAIDPNRIAAREQLRRYLADSSTDEVNDFCRIHRELGPHLGFAVPWLTPHLLNQEHDLLNLGVVGMLESIGSPAAPSAPILIDHIDGMAGSYAQRALVAIGPVVVPQLVEKLRDQNTAVRQIRGILSVLSWLGEPAEVAVPDVERLFDSPNPTIREQAVRTHSFIGSNSIVVQPLLDDPRPLVRRAAVLSLRHYSDSVDSTLPLLIACLSDDYMDVQLAVCETLQALGPRAEPAIAALQDYRDRGDIHQQLAARRALAKIRGD